jgi:hypothetical protein
VDDTLVDGEEVVLGAELDLGAGADRVDVVKRYGRASLDLDQGLIQEVGSNWNCQIFHFTVMLSFSLSVRF